MKKTQETTDIWKLYEKGKEYNESVSYYSTIKTNDRFVDGNQWEDVKANGLPTPTFNQFKRVINHFIAFLISRPIKVQYISNDSEMKPLNDAIKNHWELNKIDNLIKKRLK